jgi:hypothetical protein
MDNDCENLQMEFLRMRPSHKEQTHSWRRHVKKQNNRDLQQETYMYMAPNRCLPFKITYNIVQRAECKESG